MTLTSVRRMRAFDEGVRDGECSRPTGSCDVGKERAMKFAPALQVAGHASLSPETILVRHFHSRSPFERACDELGLADWPTQTIFQYGASEACPFDLRAIRGKCGKLRGDALAANCTSLQSTRSWHYVHAPVNRSRESGFIPQLGLRFLNC